MEDDTAESVPDLTGSLRVLDAMKSQPAAPTAAPRRWCMASGPTAAAFNSLGHLRIASRRPASFAPLSGFRPTSDGWIRLHANYPHHAARLMEALSAGTPQAVERTLLRMTALEAEDAICANNGAAAAVRSRDEWVLSPMHAVAGAGQWITFPRPPPASRGSVRPASWVPSAEPLRPLAGLKVLDLTRVIAGPTATRLLGALGADVLRIDPPQLPELVDAFVDSGFDKRSAEADFGNAAALETVRGLVGSADVVVTGYREGGLDRFGLGPAGLSLGRPGLVVVTLSAWGSAGPWNGRRGFDSLVQAACGIAQQYGRTTDGGWKPGSLPVQALDHATGYGMAAAVIALLAERLSTGTGGTARLSLARTAEELLRLPEVTAPVSPLPEPDFRYMDSPYGLLRYVGPPIMADGVPLGYTQAPVRYGTSPRRWR